MVYTERAPRRQQFQLAPAVSSSKQRRTHLGSQGAQRAFACHCQVSVFTRQKAESENDGYS